MELRENEVDKLTLKRLLILYGVIVLKIVKVAILLLL